MKPLHKKPELTLDDLPPKGVGVVRDITAETSMKQRLMDLGVTEGAIVEMVRPAPFGDPVQIRVRNTILALRRSEARHIIIDYLGERKHVRHRHRFGWKP